MLSSLESWSECIANFDTVAGNMIQRLLLTLDPERAHALVERLAGAIPGLPFHNLIYNHYSFRASELESTVVGISFPNPVGLAAGFDKTGALYPLLSHLGFGFIESGTFTDLAQEGNPRPRIFRFKKERAIINRMGFNNPGADGAATLLAAQEKSVPRGINIGKSRAVELEAADKDYLRALHKLVDYGDYIVVNVSSPNTPGLRELQGKAALTNLLNVLFYFLVRRYQGHPKPIFLKISPDLNRQELDDVLEAALDTDVNGLVIANTSIDRDQFPLGANVEGGLSGVPLRKRTTDMIRLVYRLTGGVYPIIGVGGIFSGEDALEKIQAGASLVQLYTGYIYKGPSLPARINAFLADFIRRQGTTLEKLVGSET